MKALSLFGVFLFVRVAVLAESGLPLSAWMPVACLWQDLLVVLLFCVVDRLARSAWLGWTLYGATTLYVAINLPLTLLLSSPLTLPMLRAARGTLADSITHHLTAGNLTWIGAVIAIATILPLLLRQCLLSKGWCAGLIAASLAVIALGPVAVARVDTGGLHRNVFIALLSGRVPRVAAVAESHDWRVSPFSQEGEGEDLSRFHGAARGRNVVLILLESTGAQYLRPYGAAEDPMPTLTALSHEAILFENAYAVYPESIKGLFSVLCSHYPALDTKAEMHARVAARSSPLATCLGQAGYRTALFHSGRFAYLGMEEILRHQGFDLLEDAGDIGGNRQSSFGVDDTATVSRMLDWIDSMPRNRSFFITYLPVSGHHPYDTPTPGPFPTTDEVGRYRNALHYSDQTLAKFLDGLKARSLFDQTLFVILGDHGEAFGQHEGNFGHTLFIHEENVRVPCVVSAPGLISKPIRVARPTSLIDTTPTILDLTGVAVCRAHQGASMLDPRPRMTLFMTDYSLALLGLRDGRWKFTQELDSGRSKLFDLAVDPQERRNLAALNPERVHAYRKNLIGWSAAQRNLVLEGASEF